MLKGLASDGGLFIPEVIPSFPADWQTAWRDLSFQDLAFELMSLYVSPEEIPPQDLKDIIARSYSTFRYSHSLYDAARANLDEVGGYHASGRVGCGEAPVPLGTVLRANFCVQGCRFTVLGKPL